MSRDLRFDENNQRFQLRVGAVIIEDDCLLLAKCDAADYYYSVGGAVKMGETAEQAIKREVFEETGLYYEVERLLFVQENFFVDKYINKNLTFHEVCLHFLMKPQGKKEITAESYSSTSREYMHWIPLAKLSEIKMFPVFYPEKLKVLPTAVEHIVTKEI